MVCLPVFGIFNMPTDADACDCRGQRKDNHWNLTVSKANVGRNFGEREGGAPMGFSERPDTILK